jgi:hypothetical protein
MANGYEAQGITQPPHGLHTPMPFGERGMELGETAYKLLHDLSQPIDWTPGQGYTWQPIDQEALRSWTLFDGPPVPDWWEWLAPEARDLLEHQIEASLSHMPDGPIGSPERIAKLDRLDKQLEDFVLLARKLWSDYRDATPFTEAEGRWLLNTYRNIGFANPSVSQEQIFAAINAEEGRIMSSGLRRVVYGHDLLRRWWSWRRQTDEYTGQGSLDAARLALAGIYEYTMPRERWPESYVYSLRPELQELVIN